MDDMLRQRIRNDYHRLSRLIVEGRDILASLAVILETLERESNGQTDGEPKYADRRNYPDGNRLTPDNDRTGYLGYPYRVNR